jgi:cation diffusion facilitator CzcD-associated flavoprotein CzcO
MKAQHIETLIVGAGQAGLSTGYHLKRRGRPFLIVDGNQRIGDNWRRQWDTLRCTPRRSMTVCRDCRSRGALALPGQGRGR